ncbi:MAG: MauE/DoxX family redox-associated membrane protein, partial [Ktedonobacteraceae bacterium]
MSILLLVARLLLAVVFVVSGLAKIADLKGSQKAVEGFGVPSLLAVPLGTILPFAELAVAVALIPTASALYGAIGAAVLLVVFIIGISANLSVG